MAIKEKVTEKENTVRSLLEKLRNNLNSQRLEFNKNPNAWTYITSLTHTETKLKELIEYFETSPR